MLELKLGKLRIFLSLIRKRFSLVAVAQGTQAVKTVHINMNCKDGTEQAVVTMKRQCRALIYEYTCPSLYGVEINFGPLGLEFTFMKKMARGLLDEFEMQWCKDRIDYLKTAKSQL